MRLRPVGVQDCLVLVAFYSAIVIQLSGLSDDPGLGWHLRSGEFIFHNLSFIRADTLLAGEPRPWVAEQWLGSLLLYALYYWCDWPLAYALLSVLYLGTYFGGLYRGACFGSLLGATVGVLFAFKMGQVHFIMRPVIFNFPLFTAVLLVCLGLRRQVGTAAESRAWRRAFLVLPPLFALWANIHPAFLFGLALLGLVPAALFLDGIWAGRSLKELLKSRILWRLNLLWGVAAAATFINPYVWQLHASVLLTFGGGYIQQIYTEWQPLQWQSFEGELWLIVAAIIAVGLALRGPKRLGWGSYELMILALFAWLAADSIRFLPFFGIVAAVPLMQVLVGIGQAPFFESRRLFRRLGRAFAFLEQREGRSYRGQPQLLLLSAALLLLTGGLGRVPFYAGTYGPAPDSFPYQAVAELRELAAEREVVVLNYTDWGGFIAWAGAGRVKPVIDDRTQLLGENYYRRYYAAMKPGGDWRAYAAKQQADYLLLQSDSNLVPELEAAADLRLLYRDELAVIFALSSE